MAAERIAYSGGLLPEQRLWLGVVLLGISDARHPRADHPEAFDSIAGSARAWLGSVDFSICCALADLDPNHARHIPPDRAARALHLTLNGSTFGGIHRELQGGWAHD